MRDFFRPVATLLTGTVAAQVIVYAARPLLTRLFTPDDFGVLGFYAGFVAVVAAFASGKFEDALMLPHKDNHAWALAGASVLLSSVTAVLVLGLLPFRDLLAPLVSNSVALDMLLLAPLSVVFVGVARTADAWLTRRELFAQVAKGRVVHAASSVPTQTAAGATGWGPVGLIGGLVLGQALQSAYYAVRS
ncbi:MAG: oligosaccharide flippase family protein, partial [Rhodothermales bacterium]|nr:oligosaccharide flippase family protein [Rhodothermales bacterium]